MLNRESQDCMFMVKKRKNASVWAQYIIHAHNKITSHRQAFVRKVKRNFGINIG
jgi:hypothetical protein